VTHRRIAPGGAAVPHIRKHIAEFVVRGPVFRSGTRRVQIAAALRDVHVPERNARRHGCNSPADVVGARSCHVLTGAANCTRRRHRIRAFAAEWLLP